MTMVWEPADGVAIARCMAARFRDRDHRVTVDHPSSCGWCDYPIDELERQLTSFNAWAGHDERSNSYSAHEVRRFYDLPREEQRDLITAAQDLTGHAWPPRTPPPTPVAEPEPDVMPEWMR